MRKRQAYAKINLAHVVGPLRPDGRHEVASVLQRIDLCDTVHLARTDAGETVVDGFDDDTLVREALTVFAAETGEGGWHARIEKRIPVAAGLGGGSSDAAAALALANGLTSAPLPNGRLRELAATLGADLPFFLATGPQLATGYGTEIRPLSLPEDFVVLVVLPFGVAKSSTADVYRAFDERDGAEGFESRRRALMASLDRVQSTSDLASLPGNDLASAPLARDLVKLGAFKADVTGAGPAVYGLFESEDAAARAAATLRGAERSWLVRPVGDG